MKTKTSDERISELLKQLDGDSKRLTYEAENELLRIVKEEGSISRAVCNHPDFADHDCDDYNYCGLCGRSWSR